MIGPRSTIYALQRDEDIVTDIRLLMKSRQGAALRG